MFKNQKHIFIQHGLMGHQGLGQWCVPANTYNWTSQAHARGRLTVVNVWCRAAVWIWLGRVLFAVTGTVEEPDGLPLVSCK